LQRRIAILTELKGNNILITSQGCKTLALALQENIIDASPIDRQRKHNISLQNKNPKALRQ
jgi:hypothetical protein